MGAVGVHEVSSDVPPNSVMPVAGEVVIESEPHFLPSPLSSDTQSETEVFQHQASVKPALLSVPSSGSEHAYSTASKIALGLIYLFVCFTEFFFVCVCLLSVCLTAVLYVGYKYYRHVKCMSILLLQSSVNSKYKSNGKIYVFWTDSKICSNILIKRS